MKRNSHRNVLLTAAAMLGLMVGASASAGVIDVDTKYQVNNHPDGAAASPYYGLRLDGLLTGNSRHVYTFDFDAENVGMMMYWDSTTGDLRIWGTAFGGRDTGSSYDPNASDYWDIDFTYTDLQKCGDAYCANMGSGTIASNLFGSFDLLPVGKKKHGYTFKLDFDHRGFSGISGWGWLNHCPSEGNDSDGGSCDRHLYASDWLFTAQAVPEPAPLALLGLGLLGIAFTRRKILQAKV